MSPDSKAAMTSWALPEPRRGQAGRLPGRQRMDLPAARRGDAGNRAPAFIVYRNDRGPAALMGRPQGNMPRTSRSASHARPPATSAKSCISAATRAPALPEALPRSVTNHRSHLTWPTGSGRPEAATTSMGHIINARSLARTYLPINHVRMLPLGSCRLPGDCRRRLQAESAG
jgi:hypothetical protein